MELKFLYHPVRDIDTAVEFFSTQLGWEEAWREGDLTVAFWLPDRSAQVMCSLTEQPPGPMYLVEDLESWRVAHPQIVLSVAREDIPGGSVAGFSSPDGNTFYVYDQPNA